MGFQVNKISICLSLVILVIGVYILSIQTAKRPDRLPLRSITVFVPDEPRIRFLSNFELFGRENGFRAKIAPLHPVKKEFGLSLWRGDVEIYGSNVLIIEKFDISFYAAEDGSYSMPIVDDLFKKLLAHIAQVKGVTIKSTN